MTDPMDHLGSVSRVYAIKAAEFRDIAVAAAKAEAHHKSARAKEILRAQAEGESLSHNRAETIADADDEIGHLLTERLVSAAMADAHKEQLRQLREQNANGRTMVVNAREIDRLHANDGADL
jgi:hypothetical protein